jgi:hypothetical protein
MGRALRIVGMVLLLWALGMQFHGVLGALREATATPEAAAREHLHDMAEHAGHAEPPSSAPVSKLEIGLTAVLLGAGALLALWPVAAGRMWGVWALVAVWLALVVPRLVSDPRCWVAYDPTKHGCHTFMGSVVLGTVGLVLAAVGTARAGTSTTEAQSHRGDSA